MTLDRKSRNRRGVARFSVPLAIAIALGSTFAPGVASGNNSAQVSETTGQDDQLDVNLVSGSISTPLAIGDKIPGLATLTDGQCSVTDKISLSLSSSENGSGSVTVSFDESCALVVKDTSWTAGDLDDTKPLDGLDGVATRPSGDPNEALAPVDAARATTPLSLAYDHRHHGWTKAAVLEQFGLTSTETYASIRYWQDTNVLWNGHNYSDSYCYHSSYPGWDPIVCQYAILETTGPGFITNKVHGYYHNVTPPRPTWSLDAKFRATKDNDWNSTCDLYDGSLPPFWDLRCNGARSGAY